MEFLVQLWLPIVVSAVLVFIASSLIHMVFKWHNPDYLKLANEDEVRAVVRASKPPPGQYMIPHCQDMKAMRSPEFQQKYKDGPVGFLVLREPAAPSMGPALAQWFVFTLGVSVIGAYLASRTLPDTATFGQVLRVVATTAFLAYGGGSIIQAIWMGKPWVSTAKEILDGLIYGALTGATFGWLWPR